MRRPGRDHQPPLGAQEAARHHYGGRPDRGVGAATGLDADRGAGVEEAGEGEGLGKIAVNRGGVLDDLRVGERLVEPGRGAQGIDGGAERAAGLGSVGVERLRDEARRAVGLGDLGLEAAGRIGDLGRVGVMCAAEGRADWG